MSAGVFKLLEVLIQARNGVEFGFVEQGICQISSSLQSDLNIMSEDHFDSLSHLAVTSSVMTTMTHDADHKTAIQAQGFVVALISAAAFGMSGSLARGLLDAGWSPAAAVTLRVLGAFAILAIPAYRAMRGRWHLLTRNWSLLVGYGLMAVVVAQLGYFSAVEHMSVSSALLMEYTSPVLVVLYMWFIHKERPNKMTWIGIAIAAGGLVLVLDLLSGAAVSGAGMMWGAIAMVGGATYFIISAHDNDLPPIVLAAGGMLVGGLGLGLAGLFGVVEMTANTNPVFYRATELPWWVPMFLLCLVTAAIAYVAGIVASRLLGARVASFVALTEVLFAIAWAWFLVGEATRPVQLVGAALVLGGVVVVKLGEREIEESLEGSGATDLKALQPVISRPPTATLA